ncbi:MAG TPA: PAS domain S-box protein, partial [Bacteroidia bacterium]|nr:PAS domain S-box protein [Bacteroidia bacterium]
IVFTLSRPVVRWMAYVAIATLIMFSSFLCYQNKFSFDDALTYIGVYVICSMYFRTTRDLLIYLFSGFALACLVVIATEDPEINTAKFLLRMFLGGVLVFCLSWGTRLVQGRLVKISKEIEERNRALDQTRAVLEERLTREQLLAMVASRANAIVMITDKDDVVEWVNEEFTRITGYESHEIIGQQPSMLRGVETDEETIKRIRQKKQSGEAFHDEILNYRKDGTEVWLQMHVTPLKDEQGEIEYFITIQEDITESKNTSEELQRSREMLKAAQRQAKIGSWEWFVGNDYMYCSEEMCRTLGITYAERIPVSHVFSYIHPEDLPVVRRSVEDIIRRRSPFELDCRVISQGQTRYLYITGQSNEGENGWVTNLFGTIQDITERKRIEEEMRVAEKQYRSLFEYSQHMICMHDLDGIILSINPSGAHTLGYEPEELIGRQIRSLVPERYNSEFDEYMNEIRRHGMHSGLMRMILRNGEETIWMYSNIRLSDPEGNPFVLSSNVEITGRYMMEKELRGAKKLAEEALISKDRFVANISHELRTPMNAIGGFTELLKKTSLTTEQDEYTDAIGMATENLTAMINDILDIAKIEAGKIEFERRVFNVRDVMRKAHILLSPKADQAGIKFSWTCSENVPAYVVSDDLRLTQILVNLVGNAVKFTSKGFVSFGCDIKAETERQLSLLFWIEDSGIGIPKEKLEMIFDPFTQASASANRKFGGTGLGLTIVKDLVELQGGTVSVQSAEGIGSRFEVILPVERIDAGMVQQVDVALKPIEHPGHVHVLLVEDHALNQQLALRLIRDFGFTASLASNGRAAVEVLKEEKFDVILMDLQMPEMDGYDTTTYIRNRMHITTPIIALTAHSSSGEKEKCLALGMNDYMTKPYRSKDLYYKIVRSISSSPDDVKQPDPDVQEYSTPLKALASGDKEFELEMLVMMLKSFPEDFARMQKAATTGDMSTLKTVAHRMKSSVALAGEKQLTDWLSELEHANGSTDVVLDYVKKVLAEKDALIGRIEKQVEEVR